MLIITLSLFVTLIDVSLGGMAKSVCRTKDCLDFASFRISEMDKEIDPCKNFKKFACSKKGILERPYLWDHQFLAHALNADKKSDKGYNQETMLATYFHSCQNTKEKAWTDEIANVKQLMIEKVKWPILLGSAWKASRYNPLKQIIELEKEGLRSEALFHLDMFADGEKYGFSVDSPAKIFQNLNIANLNPTNSEELFKKMMHLASLLGVPKDVAEPEITDAFKLLNELSNAISFKLKPHIPVRYNITEGWNRLYDIGTESFHTQYSWASFLRNLMDGLGLDKTLITDDQRLIIFDKSYMKALSTALTRYSPRTVANYVGMILAMNEFRFFKDFRLSTGTVDDWMYTSCEVFILFEEHTKMLLEDLMMRHNMNNGNQELLEKIFNGVKRQFKIAVTNGERFNEETKRQLVENIESIKLATDLGLSSEELSIVFEKTVLDENNFSKNVREIRKAWTIAKYLALASGPHDEIWRHLPRKFGIPFSFDGTRRFVFFSRFSTRYPWISPKAPHLLSYANVGFYVGHEIAHFYNAAIVWDKNGQFNPNWCSEYLHHALHNSSGCLANQYEELAYEEYKEQIDGHISSHELLSDVEGMRAAFNAFVSDLKENGDQQTLPGLEEYTLEQAFFIIRQWDVCQPNKPSYVEWRAYHPAAYLRSQIQQKNSKELLEAFDCPIPEEIDECKLFY